MVGFLVGIGLTSHFFANPASSSQDELTTWLLTFADKEKTSLASEKLQSAILDSSGDIDQALAAASRVIAENPDLFNLPENGDESNDKEVLEVLIRQWNSSDETGGMAKAVQPERNRSATTPVEFHHTQQGNYVDYLITSGTSYVLSLIPGAQDLVNYLITPLINGISINAP
jgi:hypothetical protein